MRVRFKTYSHIFISSQSINDNSTLDFNIAPGKVPAWEGLCWYISIPDRVWIETSLARAQQQIWRQEGKCFHA